MNRRGSLMKFMPAFIAWLPPRPDRLHEKSSRNCHFCCCVCCGVLPFWPMVTPLGKLMFGSRLFALIALANSAYWKMNSFSFEPPSTRLWLMLNELNLFSLLPQLLGGDSGPAP